MKRIYAIEKWCIDCKRCEVACAAFHSPYQDAIKAYKLDRDNINPRVHVEGDLELSVAVNCRHCKNAPCVAGCISGAMRQDEETGVVTSDPDKCVGCRTCVTVCPYGAVQVRTVHGRDIAIKCDLCGDGHGQPGDPACVKACPNRALVYMESE